MNVYEFAAKGLALSSVIIVRAGSRATATDLAKQWLKEQELPVESLQFCKVTKLGFKSQVVYAWNGDY